ncbi:MAG: alanine racemase [Nitrospirae bacterium]|nr:alanine racemase [Nitrospirota bacterium]
MDRGAIAEINLKAIAHNFRATKAIAKNRPVIAVVKADAYGHGADEISACLEKEGVSYFAVAYTAEAVILRQNGIKTPIIVFFDGHDIRHYFKYNLIPVIHNIKTAQNFSKEAKKTGQRIEVHIKVDTGMGRIGFLMEEAVQKIIAISKMGFISVTGIMSHFPDADLSDRSYALTQLERFNIIKSDLTKVGIKSNMYHIANSAAVMSLPQAHLDAVRPGLMLYGYSPFQDARCRIQDTRYEIEDRKLKNRESCIMNHVSSLRPAMTVKTKILTIRKLRKGTPISYGRTFITKRESLIAVLPIGYADGYMRTFSNNSEVLVRGRQAPVVGRVCMDTTMADVTDVRGVAENDEVVLLGKQKDDVITASELAMRSGTIPYEILTSLGSKSRKVYIK